MVLRQRRSPYDRTRRNSRGRDKRNGRSNRQTSISRKDAVEWRPVADAKLSPSAPRPVSTRSGLSPKLQAARGELMKAYQRWICGMDDQTINELFSRLVEGIHDPKMQDVGAAPSTQLTGDECICHNSSDFRRYLRESAPEWPAETRSDACPAMRNSGPKICSLDCCPTGDSEIPSPNLVCPPIKDLEAPSEQLFRFDSGPLVIEDSVALGLSDYEDSFLSESDEEVGPLPLDHPFSNFRDKLCDHAMISFLAWRSELDLPGEDTPARLLVCPFYHKNPVAYRNCLTGAFLRTIADLKRHLWNIHPQPHYCPICFDTFSSRTEMDEHIVRRKCEKQPVMKFDGLTQEHKDTLLRRPGPVSELEQWLEIWSMLFERAVPPVSPYIEESLAVEIELVRRYWKTNAEAVVTEYLIRKQMLDSGENGEGAIAALQKAVMDDLLGRVAADWYDEVHERSVI